MKLLIVLSALFTAGVFSAANWPISSNPPARMPERIPVFCAPSFDPQKMKAGKAPIFKGLGNHVYKITTSSPKAQEYFNQGLRLVYAFNHTEAGRSFNAAIEADPSCAMAYWGLGMVLGPNYNNALNPASLADINQAMDKAMQYSKNASAREKALIVALSKRFPREPVSDMTPFNAAYAAEMKNAAQQFPDDADIAALYADALMNEHPWNLWLKDGTAQPWTPPIIATLEDVLKRWPNHPGANHMYIHAVEASAEARKGLVAAGRLKTMMPSAGHMVHMPSHIYIRTGHYYDGVLVNEQASLADSSYITQCKVQGSYALMLYPHNVHFLAACAFLAGSSQKAIDAAWRVARIADKRYLNENPTIQHYYSIPFFVLAQLGRADEILQLSKPAETLKYPTAIWHYARGMAYAAKGESAKAEAELAALRIISQDPSVKALLIWEMNSVADITGIAERVLEAEISARHEQFDKAITLLNDAVAIEDRLTYQEPPDWFFSVRHSLGKVLLKAGKFAEAERVYLDDLKTFPENGYALKGLYNALVAQNKMPEAAEVNKRFAEAWKHADFKLTSSRPR